MPLQKTGLRGVKKKPTPSGTARRALAALERVVFPVAGAQRRAGGITSSHRALDIPAQLGTPVLAARSGIVRISSGDRGYGNLVRVQNPATGLEALYAHLSGFASGLRSGEYVQAGQVIGYVGSTGNSTGPHLHFEVNPIGPEHFRGGRSDLAAVDPWAYLTGAVNAPVVGLPSIASVGGTTGQVKKLTKQRIAGTATMVPANISAGPGQARSVTPAPSGITQLAAGQSKPGAGSDKAILGALGGPTYGEVGKAAGRVGFIVGGFALILLGVLVMVWSFRDEIAGAVESTKSEIQNAAGVAKTVAVAGA